MSMSTTTNLGLGLPTYDDAADIPEIYNENMQRIDAGAVIKNQGIGNAGKFLIVGNDGAVVPTTVPFANGGTY